MHQIRALLAATVIVAALAACGGSDDAAPSEVSETEVSETGTADSGTIDASATDVVDAVGAQDALDDVGFGAVLFGLASSLGGEYELVDETTGRITLDGSVDDTTTACIVVGALISPEQSVTLVYPDGEFTCG